MRGNVGRGVRREQILIILIGEAQAPGAVSQPSIYGACIAKANSSLPEDRRAHWPQLYRPNKCVPGLAIPPGSQQNPAGIAPAECGTRIACKRLLDELGSICKITRTQLAERFP